MHYPSVCAPLHANPSVFPFLEMKAEVVFGSPSQNCGGSGICMMISRLPRTRVLPCPHAPAFVAVVGNTLRFRFLKDQTMEPYAQRYFSKGYFEVMEGYRLPLSISRGLGMFGVGVMPGKYRVEETAQEWRFYVRYDF
jgi:hypothetical protein